ncbi:MAG TPA: type IV secretory system conjugative DNA transfer family protein [Candidatus Acidoferrales bacterium]|nr:type IV secretory system conjugative DNA transfer family protein [Candidatus Acidoferrales bacterium]
MSQIVIGKAGSHNVAIDLKTLLATRLLLTADSGGGKTWAMKRLIEQAFGHVGILVIDPEGEFAPMRQKLDFYLVGKGGDTPADPRSAGKVARALIGVRASAICDIYELKPSERHAFVRNFLEALIEAPKELRRPYLVIVDEAHMFCPEKGKGESEAAEPMRDLCTRGRKRLLCAVFATQRLAALSKDASGMLLNRLIGPTFEDINRKTAADILSIPKEKAERDPFMKRIQLLDPGNFFALGRAISKELVLLHVGPIETPHGEEARKYEIEPPPPTEKVCELLAKLGDLPKQAEEEARTVADFKKRIRELKHELTLARRSAPATNLQPSAASAVHGKPVVDSRLIARAVESALREHRSAFIRQAKSLQSIAGGLHKISELAGDFEQRAMQLSLVANGAAKLTAGPTSLGGEILRASGESHGHQELSPVHKVARHAPDLGADTTPNLKAGARKMLTILAQWHPEPRTRDQLGALSGFAPEGGTFGEYMRALVRGGFVTENGSGASITDEGLATVGPVPPRPESSDELVAMWKSKFKAGVGKMLDVLVAAYPDAVTAEELGQQTGFAHEGGTFGEYLRALRRSKLIEEAPEGIKAAESLFP